MLYRLFCTQTLVGITLLGLLGCSGAPSDVTSTGGGTEIVCFHGSAVDTSGSVIAGASVRVRRTDYLTAVSLGKQTVFSADAVTDDSGAFLIQNIDTGTYFIEISSASRCLGAVVCCTVAVRDTQISLRRIRLCATATIYGQVPRHYRLDPARVNVQIYGLERSSITDSSGQYYLRDVPVGIYSLHLVAGTPEYNPLDLNVQVNRSGITEMGSFSWPMNGPGIFPADSAALRAILDSNGLFTIPLQQVMSFDGETRRITDLRLQNLRIRTLTSRIGDLSNLRTLNAEHNSLVGVPAQIGSLKSLQVLVLRSNQIPLLPPQIGELDSLLVFDVSMNYLGFFPPQIGGLHKLAVLSAGENQLDSLPSALGECTSLKVIAVPRNRLRTVPAELSHIASLEFLELQENLIDSLPEALFQLGSMGAFQINIDDNLLGSLSAQNAHVWIDQYSANPQWRQTQQW